MCGIAGIISTTSDKRVEGNPLTLLAHRGPDSQGDWKDHIVCLYHARLSIIDTNERANQPYIDNTGEYVLVFNGEIYNYQELRKQLSFNWQTSSDTEVLMEWLKAYGISRLKDLDGMFAFAFYDRKKSKLILARDRFGKKPLYIYSQNEKLSFASDTRVLFDMYPETKFCSKQQVSNWLLWQTIPNNQSLSKDIEQVEPGHYLIWDNGDIKRGLYVSLKSSEEIRISSDDALDEIKKLLCTSVQKRLVADVPFACFLSGGIDSSIITALAAKELGSKLNTFTISFDETAYSEHDIAAQVAQRYQTQHHEIRLTPQHFLELVEEGLAATDHPSGDGLNTYVVSKYTRIHGFKMALSGIGGDEWFLGYPYFRKLDAYKKLNFLSFAKSVSNLLPFQMRKMITIVDHLHQGAAAYAFQRNLFDPYSIQYWFNLPRPDLYPNEIIFPDTMSARSLEEWRYYTQPVLLRDTDQYSMAVGLELRAPFMDHQLVEFALRLPDKVKLGNKPKHLLIEAFKEELPQAVYNRKKQGFTLPWEKWMRNELNSFSHKRIEAFADRLNTPIVRKKWKSFCKGSNEVSWSRWWSIVSVEDYLSRNNIEVK